MVESGYSGELLAMGFSGLLLKRISPYIVDSLSMEEWCNFIILHGADMVKAVLVHRFIAYMQEKRSYTDYNEFLTQYTDAETPEQKQFSIQKLLVIEAESPMLKKVEAHFNQKPDQTSNIYHKIVGWRGKYRCDQIVSLLDEMFA